jgi:hypothetical protein
MTMLNLAENVRTGAAANRRTAKKNPMEILAEMRVADPTGSYGILRKKWGQKVERDCLEEALDYLYRLFWTQLDNDDRRSKSSKSSSSPLPKITPEEIREQAERVRQIVLSDVILPTGKGKGKAVRYATFRECAQADGWFLKVSRKGKPDQIVGEVLSEEQLRKL